MPRFLEKLKVITETTPSDIASWSEDGKHYEIHSSRFETEILAQHFDAKRSLLSFIRQLNYYGFKKLEHKGCEWAIAHPNFQRDNPHLIYEIKRKTRKEQIVTASKDEVQTLRTEVGAMKRAMMAEIEQLRTHVCFLQNQLNRLIHSPAQMPPMLSFPASFSRMHYKHEPMMHARSRSSERHKRKRKRHRSHPALPAQNNGHSSSSSGGSTASNSSVRGSDFQNGQAFSSVPH